jgi:hypothetical protein
LPYYYSTGRQFLLHGIILKLSLETIELLRHFARIQPGLVINAGNILKARTEALYAEATVAETFPVEFGIAYLGDFLRTLSFFRDPVLDFTPEHLRIIEADGTAEAFYECATPASSYGLPMKRSDIACPSGSINGSITADQWSMVQKALGSSVVRKQDDVETHFMSIVSDGKTVRIGTELHTYRGLSGYSLAVNAETRGHECKMLFRRENVPTMAGAYEVTVRPRCTEFKHASGYNLYYVFGPEPGCSSWGGKQTYRVAVTKSIVQDGLTYVEAYSPEEAEAMIQQRSDQEFQWTTEPRLERGCRVVEGVRPELQHSSVN